MKSGYRGSNQRAGASGASGARCSNQRKGGNDAIHGHINRIPERILDPNGPRKPEVLSEVDWHEEVISKLPMLEFSNAEMNMKTNPENARDKSSRDKYGSTKLENLDDVAAIIGCRPKEMVKVLASLLGTDAVFKHTHKTKRGKVYLMPGCYGSVELEGALQGFLGMYSLCGVCGKERLVKDRMRWRKHYDFWWNSCRECESQKPEVPVERPAEENWLR